MNPGFGFALIPILTPNVSDVRNALNFCFSTYPFRFQTSDILPGVFESAAANGNIARLIVTRGRCRLGRVSLLLFPSLRSTMAAGASRHAVGEDSSDNPDMSDGIQTSDSGPAVDDLCPSDGPNFSPSLGPVGRATPYSSPFPPGVNRHNQGFCSSTTSLPPRCIPPELHPTSIQSSAAQGRYRGPPALLNPRMRSPSLGPSAHNPALLPGAPHVRPVLGAKLLRVPGGADPTPSSPPAPSGVGEELLMSPTHPSPALPRPDNPQPELNFGLDTVSHRTISAAGYGWVAPCVAAPATALTPAAPKVRLVEDFIASERFNAHPPL